MPQAPVSKRDLQSAVNAAHAHNFKQDAAKALGIPPATLAYRLKLGLAAGLVATTDRKLSDTEVIHRLETELREVRAESADVAAIKAIIGGLVEKAGGSVPPIWLNSPKITASGPGVPTLFLSDFTGARKSTLPKLGGSMSTIQLQLIRAYARA